MITEHQEKNKCICLKIESIEEKRVKLLQHPLAILKISIILFLLKAPQEAIRQHLPHNNTPSATSNLPTSKQLNYSARQNQTQPKVPEKYK
jgi:hypothetical protein